MLSVNMCSVDEITKLSIINCDFHKEDSRLVELIKKSFFEAMSKVGGGNIPNKVLINKIIYEKSKCQYKYLVKSVSKEFFLNGVNIIEISFQV